MIGFKTLPLNSDTSVVGKSPNESYLKLIELLMAKIYKIFKNSKFLIFDARNELMVSKLVGKVYLDAQKGQFWQILYHVQYGQVYIKFGRKRWKFQIIIKYVILNQFLWF